MRLMLISDIHANLPALKAVFEDMKHYFGSADYVISAGDIVGIGPFPNGVCNALRHLKNFMSVRGECDQATLDGKYAGIELSIAKSIEWTRENISEENLIFLDSLETYLALDLEGFKIFVVHGSPENPLGGMISGAEPIGNLNRYFSKTNADIIICGHTHIPFVKEINGKYIINPGSVGEPRDGNPAASYTF
ncbi:MAG: metallophosphoesterase family protein, partial [Candidatus Aenigmarchaeota archaeon]|nr:metallophosphoesterase family protein [Candidatus Aenigmarchaeota archaeon]